MPDQATPKTPKPDPVDTRIRCMCGHTGYKDDKGVFICNVCKGKGRYAEPWPGSNNRWRLQPVNRFIYDPTDMSGEEFNMDPAWLEPDEPRIPS